ncbi:MAG: SDR family NAD(P)-dependent oxidoreductase [Clostridiales bacterium]|nr:SDR family NAD(P)-dependent oxidoreductase [Clostridiales bacterium]
MSKKTILVTGSSRGIGKAIAIRFAQEGYNIIINCVKQKDLLLDLKAQIEAYQVPCLAFVGDVGDYDVVQELYKQAINTFGSIDVLVNNAGISHIGLFTDMSILDWNKVIRTNLTSVFNCCSVIAPEMIKRKSGKIINISSVWGNVGASCEVAYSASKGGVNSFTKALAKELAPSNIQVNAIACGAIATEMNQFLSKDELGDLINEIPANRLGRADEVANLVYQIATYNDYLTGQVITLDGGWIG